MKICGTCRIEKADDEFHWKVKNKLRHSRCKVCQLSYAREHYQRNKTKYLAGNSSRLKILREKIQKLKEVPCKDCGQTFPYYVMDFDHRRDKKFNIAESLKKPIKELMDEISKCDVVCSNCHRIRTHNRMVH